MKIMHVVPRIATQSSGPSYSVARLCETLQKQGGEVQLHVLDPLPKSLPACPVSSYPTSKWPGSFRLGWSPLMRNGLVEATKSAHIIHNHSMWMMPNIYSYTAARAAGCKLVFSPRGTLSKWALSRSPIRKRLVWWAGQKAALCGADCLHATSESELEEIRNLGLKQPVAVIPNGVDVPDGEFGKNKNDNKRRCSRQRRFALPVSSGISHRGGKTWDITSG